MSSDIFVFGSYVTDMSCRSSRFPEAGETIRGNSFRHGPGGKGSNQAVAAHKAGGKVHFMTKIGKDSLGLEALEFYKELGMSTENILISEQTATGAALIMVDEETAQNRIIVIGGACQEFTDAEACHALSILDHTGILLTQFETNLSPVYRLIHSARDRGITTVVNPAPACDVDPELFKWIDILTPNETEAEFYTGIRVTDMKSAEQAARCLAGKGVKNIIITLGSMGAYVYSDSFSGHIPPKDCGQTIDTTGAGDAFSGGLVTALSEGASLREAAEFASLVAGIAVTRPGTAPSMPNRDEIEQWRK